MISAVLVVCAKGIHVYVYLHIEQGGEIKTQVVTEDAYDMHSLV